MFVCTKQKERRFVDKVIPNVNSLSTETSHDGQGLATVIHSFHSPYYYYEIYKLRNDLFFTLCIKEKIT